MGVDITRSLIGLDSLSTKVLEKQNLFDLIKPLQTLIDTLFMIC